jgi:hypothetical protein
MPALSLFGIPRAEWLTSPVQILLAALLALGGAWGWAALRRHRATAPLRTLLGRLAAGSSPVSIQVRALFVPSGELFSRAPEYPPSVTAGLTVHKWTNIPEVHSAADVRAAVEVLHLLLAANRNVTAVFRPTESATRGWTEDVIAIGPHFKSWQILDHCEPRLMALRNPAAFRSLVSQEVFEARGTLDYGLVYKGSHPSTRRAFWVIMGLSDAGTEAAAWFLRRHAAALGRLTGGAPFAAVVAVDTGRGRESAAFRSLQPRPSWWRRLVYRNAWQQVAGLRD